MVTVAKLGGAALADAAAIRHAAEIIQAEAPTVVVASAMAGVTDRLAALADAGDAAVPTDLIDLHVYAAEEVADEPGVQAIHDAIADLAAILQRTNMEPGRRRDAIMAQGERLSVRILAGALRHMGHEAIAMDATDVGLRAFLGPVDAQVDMEAVRKNLPERIRSAAPATVILTGFYGVDQEGAILSLGRGGSDLVAAVVGAALDAQRVDLWKDVPGFMTADPRSVPQARLVDRLAYDEAAELAYFGAKVLHPSAVAPLAEAGIPVHIRSLADPASDGTHIIADPPSPQGMVRSAASRDGLAILRINGPGLGKTPGVAKQVFQILGDAGVNVINMANSQATFALLIQQDDADRALAALQILVGGPLRTIDCIKDRSLVCVVGRGLGETPGSAARLLGAVADRGVNIDMISLGASATAIDLVVPTDRSRDALQGLHDAFVGAA